MARSSTGRPTDQELEILKVLWERGPSSVRDVWKAIAAARDIGYTSVLKIMQIMRDKELARLRCDASPADVSGRAQNRKTVLRAWMGISSSASSAARRGCCCNTRSKATRRHRKNWQRFDGCWISSTILIDQVNVRKSKPAIAVTGVCSSTFYPTGLKLPQPSGWACACYILSGWERCSA